MGVFIQNNPQTDKIASFVKMGGEQYILGINGWGIRSHDASAALIKASSSGIEVVAAAEEERFIRQKHAYDRLPRNAVRFCIEQANIPPEELFAVAFGWQMPRVYTERGLEFKFDEEAFLTRLFGQALEKYPPLVFVNHHLSHAMSAFAPSGFKSSAVMVSDGAGEIESISLWAAKGDNIEKIAETDIRASLGFFYEALSEFVGLGSDQAGKTMGLAPYGDRNSYFGELNALFKTNELSLEVPSFTDFELGKPVADYIPIDEQVQVRNFWMNEFARITGLEPNSTSQNYSFRSFPKNHLNLAASGQALLENLTLHLVRGLYHKLGIQNLCLAGGVSLNCTANGRIARELGMNLYVQPAANDAGVALGAALVLAQEEGFPISGVEMTPYLGKEYSDSEIVTAVEGFGIEYEERNDMAVHIANLIDRKKIIGLCQGRFEFGPRALGNRSFIADPRAVEIWDRMNRDIKGREEGRPLAATILSFEAPNLFGREINGPYMTIAFPLVNNKLAAVRHVDGTTRPQVLTPGQNSLFYEQIVAIGRKTGICAVVNTSLNYKEPIVNSPQEALSLLKRTAVDAIVLNNRFIVYNNK